MATVQEAAEDEKRTRSGQSPRRRAVWLEPIVATADCYTAMLSLGADFRGGGGRIAVGVVVLNIRHWTVEENFAVGPAVETAMYIVVLQSQRTRTRL